MQFKNTVDSLTFEILNDLLLHFEYSPIATAPATMAPLKTTPFIYKVDIDPTALCFDVTRTVQKVSPTSIIVGREIPKRSCMSILAK